MKALISFTLLLLAGIQVGHLHAQSLSGDGTVLSGVQYNGKTYNVFFNEGVVEQTFSVAQVTAPGWDSLTDGLAAALADALSNLSPLPDPDDIHGCTSTIICLLFLPDDYDAGVPEYIDGDVVNVSPATVLTTGG